MRTWYVALMVTSWIILAAIVLLFQPARSGLLNVMMSIVGVLAALAALLFLGSRRRLFFSTCIAAGIVVLVVFVIRWTLFVRAYVGVDPEPDPLFTIWLFIKDRLAVPAKLLADGFPLRALMEFYWGIGMPIVQLAIVAFAISRTRSYLGYSGRVVNS